VLGFVVALLILPLVGRRCGMGAPAPTVQSTLPAATATPGAAIPAPTSSPLPSPTFSPLPAPTSSPLPVPTVSSGPQGAARYTYRALASYPHDPQAFTQGLVYLDGFLYEGTGLYGQSSLRVVELETGKVLQLQLLPDRFFGEGIAIVGQRIYQLTWKAKTGLIYDLETLEPTGEFRYSTEGWGLAQDGTYLIMSDGTATLHYLDPADLSEVRQVTVRDAGQPVMRLNELEVIRGEIWANVWQTNRIARIDPQDGTVVGWIDLSGLLSPSDIAAPVDVLNGIAYDDAGDRIFVTGKLWPKLFQIEVVPAE